MRSLNSKLKSIGLGLILSVAFSPALVRSELAVETMADFTSMPLVSADSAVPLVMIAASNDHQSFFKAYNDYTDLDRDGDVETTYEHSFDYYGYFDSHKCYAHNGSFFQPVGDSPDKYCGGQWSGNFLNWATMTRIDTIRKILFGGLRTTDNIGQAPENTVLERAYLPNDAHSFAKYYNGPDISRLTPYSEAELSICNTTVSSDPTLVSEHVTDPPLMRVARGNYSLWASSERWQCRWSEELASFMTGEDDEKLGTNQNDPILSGMDAYGSSPERGLAGLDDLPVKVSVCTALDDSLSETAKNEGNCKVYYDDSGVPTFKPIGLLQKFGDDDKVYFGMVAGSYLKNKSGGVVMRNIGPMSEEIDQTNGTFTKAVTSGAEPTPSTSYGIVNTWSLYRPVGYYHSDGTYGQKGLSATSCAAGEDSFTDSQCKNWGNPFSEVYLNAIRYMAGLDITGEYRSNGVPVIPGLETPQNWTDPLDETNYCATLNVVAFNGSTISYDADQLDGKSYGVGTIWPGADSESLTKLVGDGEGITGGKFLVGENGSDNNQLCTEKTVSNLGLVEGLCPEAPRLDGSYRMAGIAYKAHITDIRDAGNKPLKGQQVVDTYAVTLAPAVPEIKIPVPNSDRVVRILPACQNVDAGGNCALVDFKVVRPPEVYNGVATGKFYVNWEDSEQGGDFDQDMWGVIEYKLDAANNIIAITTNAIAESTDDRMGFGYVLSGTVSDGFHVHSGINGYQRTELGVNNDCSVGCEVATSDSLLGEKGPTTNVYSIGDSSAGLLEDPLLYAAKWGSFEDENGNNIPDLQSEWDRKDTNGDLNPDGLPDTYYYATNPRELERSLTAVLNDIVARTASGTAASVVASSREGQGALFQAMYITERTYGNRTVNWMGSLHSLWLDNLGLVREDNNQNARLDDYQTDKVVKVYYDSATRQTRICRFDSTTKDVYTPDIVNAGGECEGISLPLEQMKPLWNARERLSAINDVTSQRSYSSSADTGRYILTWKDVDLDGTVDAGESVAFTPNGFDTANGYGFFNTLSQAEADDIINYIRGQEIAGKRNRTIDFDGNGTEEIMRLGDIVHSTPNSVAAPAEAFDQLYGDVSYAEFRSQYANRRQMIYVGANDGLLHAFNAGFFNPHTLEFQLSPSGETAHPLGAEIWAYAPGNLLPHLNWLTDVDYTHVYYMDAKPRVFDAKIFTPDPDHPGGWGTVLVAGMRFGGGTMTVDTAADGFGGTGDDHKFRSAYVIMDVTNPENPPKLLAEITHENLGFTTSYPTAMTVRQTDDTPNKWYLVFGTGPTSLAKATSIQDARVLVYDLNAMQWVTDFGPSDTFNVVGAGAFVGDPLAADWDLSYKADDVYFGTVGGTPDAPTGSLYRLKVRESANPADWVLEERLTTSQPIVARPTLSVDSDLTRWVYVGTGRFYVNDDKKSIAQQTLYGIRDNPPPTATSSLPATTNLVDVTNAVVSTDPPYTVTGVTGVTNFQELENLFNATGASWKDGWKLDLPVGVSTPSARIVQEGALLGRVLLVTDYTPSESQCGGDGTSSLYGLYYKTGTPFAERPIFGVSATSTAIREINLGEGLASAPSLHLINDPPATVGDKEKVIIQKSRGDILTGDATLAVPVKSGE
ncbi:MAG: PilC/PilY family type IV pilus protein, partial [Gammaproteobacteria bacterium]